MNVWAEVKPGLNINFYDSLASAFSKMTVLYWKVLLCSNNNIYFMKILPRIKPTTLAILISFFSHPIPFLASWSEVKVAQSCLTLCDPCSPWNSPGQNTGVGSLSLLQQLFPTQELNRGLLHCRQILYQLSYEGSPIIGILYILGTTMLLYGL